MADVFDFSTGQDAAIAVLPYAARWRRFFTAFVENPEGACIAGKIGSEGYPVDVSSCFENPYGAFELWAVLNE